MAWTEAARKKAAETRKRKALANSHAAAMKRRRQTTVARQGRNESGKLTGYSGKQKELDAMRLMGAHLGSIRDAYAAAKKARAAQARTTGGNPLTRARSAQAEASARSSKGRFVSKTIGQHQEAALIAGMKPTVVGHAAVMKNLYRLASSNNGSLHMTLKAAQHVWKSAQKLTSGKKTQVKATPHKKHQDPFADLPGAGDLRF
jgi:hypothetical protein